MDGWRRTWKNLFHLFYVVAHFLNIISNGFSSSFWRELWVVQVLHSHTCIMRGFFFVIHIFYMYIHLRRCYFAIIFLKILVDNILQSLWDVEEETQLRIQVHLTCQQSLNLLSSLSLILELSWNFIFISVTS